MEIKKEKNVKKINIIGKDDEKHVNKKTKRLLLILPKRDEKLEVIFVKKDKKKFLQRKETRKNKLMLHIKKCEILR